MGYLENFRREIAARPEKFLQLLQNAEQETGVPFTAECYKRPKPTEDPRLQPYFGWKAQIGCVRHEDFGPHTFTPDLAERVRAFFRALTPVYHYFQQFQV